MIGSYWEETSTTIETPVLVPGSIVVLHEFGWHCSPLHPCLGGIVVLRAYKKRTADNHAKLNLG